MTKPAFAGFWLRLAAFIVDWLVLMIPGAIIGVVGGAGFGARLLAIVVSWLYFALSESSEWQATLGKKALSLKVTDLDGNRLSFGRATGRYFGKIVSGVILLIGYIMIGFTEKKQGLHDILAGTLVVSTNPQTSSDGTAT